MKDYIIIGFGFAGMAFCHLLEKNNKSFIVVNDNTQQSTRVSGAFYNPVVLKRFTPVWKAKEQMLLLKDFYAEIEEKFQEKITMSIPVLRKFASLEEQNNWFVSADKPILSEYLSTEIQKKVSEFLDTPSGLGQVKETGRVLTEKLMNLYRNRLLEKGEILEEHFDYSVLNVQENQLAYKGIYAKKIVFCEGFGIVENPYFSYLPIRGCKGELLTFIAPNLKINQVIKSNGFIFPDQKEHYYKIGATYEHQDKSNNPTQKARIELEEKLKALISCSYEIVHQVGAIRPTVSDRRPLVGRHPYYSNMFVLNGLGTRGSMLAPYTATALFNFIEENISIDKEMDINRFEKRWRIFNNENSKK